MLDYTSNISSINLSLYKISGDSYPMNPPPQEQEPQLLEDATDAHPAPPNPPAKPLLLNAAIAFAKPCIKVELFAKFSFPPFA